MRVFNFIAFNLISIVYFSQNRLVFNNAFAVLSNSVQLTIDNANSNAISSATIGNIISENEYNTVKWHVQNNTGNYLVPFTNLNFNKIPLAVTIANAGVAIDGSILFSTYETATDKNTIYPSDVTHLNSNCRDSVGLFAIDRFWRIEAQGYTTKPTPIINFGYDNSINEIGATNTINASKLKAQRFNSNTNSWETPQKLFGICNTSSQTVSNVQITPTDFYKSWTLIDTSLMNIPISLTSASLIAICSGNSATISATGATNYTLLPTNNTSTNGSFNVSPTSTATYSIIGSIGTGSLSCSSVNNSNNTITVQINAIPSITSTINHVKCFGENNGSITTNVMASSAFTYTWSNGSNIGSINHLFAGTYTIFIQDANLCSSSQTVNVTEPPPLALFEIENKPSCDNSPTGSLSIQLSGGTPAYSVVWSNGGNNTSLYNIPTGIITATITDANGCKTHFNTIINEEACLVTLIPQLFTPNGDGKNELFFINTASYYPNNKLEIYNRWGNLVYAKTKYANEFAGKANMSNSFGNDLLPAGTYFVVFDFGDNITQPYKGYLEIHY